MSHEHDIEDEEETLEDILQVSSVSDVVNALFDHVASLQQFIAEHGHTQEDFKAWLREYEKRSMN